MWRKSLLESYSDNASPQGNLVKLTEQMIVNGLDNNTHGEPYTFITKGDILIPDVDYDGSYKGKRTVIFEAGKPYQVLSIENFSNSSYPVAILAGEEGLRWGISFDKNINGRAEVFRKKILNSDEMREKAFKDPNLESSMYYEALFTILKRRDPETEGGKTTRIITKDELINSAFRNISLNQDLVLTPNLYDNILKFVSKYIDILVLYGYLNIKNDGVTLSTTDKCEKFLATLSSTQR